MVKKLIKYDFASYLRLLLPVQLILLGVAGLTRFIQIFEDTSSVVYNIIFTSSEVIYVISAAVCILLTTVVAIVRFYQGMYTNEGYLSHTLPVTPTMHIVSKLLTSILFELGSLLAVFLSFCIATLGDLNIELFKAGGYLIGRLYSHFHANTILYIIELVFAVLLLIAGTLLKLYFCISVGQLAKKRKILLAFGAFFGLYIVRQIIGTIVVVIFAVDPSLRYELADWMAHHVAAFYHIALCGVILFYAVTGTAYFLLTRYIMSRRLNLT